MRIPDDRYDEIAAVIVDAAFQVHRRLGPGLLESVYETCLSYEISRRGYRVERQVPVPIVYDNLTFDEGFRLDLLVENCIICELKAVEKENPVWQAQLLSYMKLTGKPLGFLINFNVPLIKNGIRRFAL
jgi:GxxExxY protein